MKIHIPRDLQKTGEAFAIFPTTDSLEQIASGVSILAYHSKFFPLLSAIADHKPCISLEVHDFATYLHSAPAEFSKFLTKYRDGDTYCWREDAVDECKDFVMVAQSRLLKSHRVASIIRKILDKGSHWPGDSDDLPFFPGSNPVVFYSVAGKYFA